jgi:hypothetical protein
VILAQAQALPVEWLQLGLGGAVLFFCGIFVLQMFQYLKTRDVRDSKSPERRYAPQCSMQPCPWSERDVNNALKILGEIRDAIKEK